MAKVFISYSKRDYIGDDGKVLQDNVVDKVIKALSEHNIDVWIDREKLDPGVTFASIIANSINDCDYFLFLSSSNSNSSEWTLREISMAIDYAKTVIPVRLDDSRYADPVALYLASIQYIDWVELGEQESLKRIINRIQGAEANSDIHRFREEKRSISTPNAFKPISPTITKASVVLAGGVCLLLVIGKIFSPFSGLIPIKGFWLSTLLATTLLCFWCGMLVRSRINKLKAWFLVLIGVLLAFGGCWIYYDLSRDIYGPGTAGMAHEYVFSFLLGLLLPWDHIRENGDHVGAKSALLFILTALSYTALFVVWQRLVVGDVMKPKYADMEQLLLRVTSIVLPLAMIPPILLAAEFSFSKAGQWLGSRKWFFWIALPAAVYCFFEATLALPPFRTSRIIRFLVQPISVYLLSRVVTNSINLIGLLILNLSSNIVVAKII